MEEPPIPSIMRAMTLGRGRRGHNDPGAWIRLRAQVLSFLALGQPLVWLDGVRTMTDAQRTRLIAEAGDAVLQSRLPSLEADAACEEVWQCWSSYCMMAAHQSSSITP